MRIFISVDIPKKLEKEITKIQNSLPEFKGKVTEPENLHLTLKFLGEIDKDKLTWVQNELAKPEFGKFEASIDSIGVFSRRNPRIIWLNLNGCSVLQNEIDELLSPLFRRERRFMGHLTIARIKSIRDKEDFLQKLKEIKITKMKFRVNEFHLNESILFMKSPKYKILKAFPLI